ncbi:hypothetical protein ACFL3M_02320, partial [Patescibacteria group bacterium]
PPRLLWVLDQSRLVFKRAARNEERILSLKDFLVLIQPLLNHSSLPVNTDCSIKLKNILTGVFE